MRKFNSVMKVQLLSYFGINKILHGKKQRIFSGIFGLILMFVVIATAIGYMGYTYSQVFAVQLSVSGEIDNLIPIMIAMGSLAGLLFSCYTVMNVVYGYNDYLLISALPISTKIVVTSKLILTFLADVGLNIVMAVPSIIVYFDYGGNLSARNIVRLAILILTCPLFSLVFSTVLGMLIAYISSKFKKKSIIQTLSFLIIFLGIGVIFGLNSGEAYKIFTKLFFIYPLVVKSVTDPLYLLLLEIGLFAVAYLAVLFVCATYKDFYNILSGKKKSKIYKLEKVEKISSFKALFKRDMGKLLSSSTYTLNTLLGPIFTVIASIVILALDLFSDLNFGGVGVYLLPLIPVILTFMLMISPPTACSLSVEGQTFWILRTSPVSLDKIFFSKILLTLVFYIPSSLLFSIVCCVVLKVSFIYYVLIILSGVLLSALSAGTGLLFNLLFPYMKWDSEVKAVKQGVSVLFCLLVASVMTAGSVLFMLYGKLPTEYYLTVLNIVYVVLTATVYILIFDKGEGLLNKKDL